MKSFQKFEQSLLTRADPLKRCVLLASCLLVMLTARQGFCFQNLDFEDGPVYHPLNPSIIYPDVLPYWTVRFGDEVQPGASCNNFVLDVPVVALMSQDGLLGADYVIAGARSAYLQASLDPFLPAPANATVSISQVGLVPVGSQSLLFDARNQWYGPLGEGFPVPPGPFEVTINGVAVPLFVLVSDGGANVRYGANISGWAGQTAELSIGVFPSPVGSGGIVGKGWSVLDSVLFSPESVPEPTVAALATLAFGVFTWLRRKSRADSNRL